MIEEGLFVGSIALQADISSTIQDVIANVVTFLPKIVAAVVILIVGWIIGRLLGGLVTRVIDTVIDAIGLTLPGGIASAVGKVVKFFVYYLALVAAADVLDITILTDLLSQIGATLPAIIGAVVILVIGFIVGSFIGELISDAIGEFGLDQYFQGTPIESLSEASGGIGGLVGKVVEYYVYLLALLAAVDALGIAVISEFVSEIAGYVPALIGAFAVFIIGIWVADLLAELIADTDASRMTDIAALGVKVFVYYLTITIALSTAGFDITVLTTLFQSFVIAFFGALAIALAVGAGLGLGLGSKDYVAENIDDWVSNAKSSVNAAVESSGSGENGNASEWETPDDVSEDDTTGGDGGDGSSTEDSSGNGPTSL